MDRRSKSKNRPLKFLSSAVLAACIGGGPVNAAEESDITAEGMKVYGQSELPKVLYIVPWKRREATSIDKPQSKSLASDVLEPIEREIFKRQIRYHELLTQN